MSAKRKTETSPPLMPCGCCGGTGRTVMPEHLHEILLVMQDHTRGGLRWTVAALWRRIRETEGREIGVTAVNQRLAKLEATGFVERTGKFKKEWLWQLRER